MSRPTLYYTFGNHMHWVDMEWLWGYHVLPGSVRDMIRLCREADVKGCVNFDGVGYEKLAAEDPEALAELREAVQEGIIEPVGCSYGQPYGLFHGGESNVRQLLYGARAVRRLLGVWPKTFWEEEFYFFPQLPQMLAGCGFSGASLFFQWTWHTPEVPKEESPVIWWEGLDGTRILAATRNKLNMHQWPEDMDAVLKGLEGQRSKDEAGGIDPRPSTFDPLIQQWLELMPSPDWMCRSELILPKLKELLSDPRFEIRSVTLGEYLRELGRDAQATIPARPYTMDQVWHGLTLGKNGDDMRHRSGQAEREILAAEVVSAIAGVLGRPYPQWDVYPTWELEEAWRNLLAAQHHDNEECEGLCGRVGKRHYELAAGLAADVLSNALDQEDKIGFTFNSHGWRVHGRDGSRTVKPFSFTRRAWHPGGLGLSLEVDETAGAIRSGPRDRLIQANFDAVIAAITELRHTDGPELASVSRPIGGLLAGSERLVLEFESLYDEDGQYALGYYRHDGDDIVIQVDRGSPHHGIDISFNWDASFNGLINSVAPGFKGALLYEVPLPWADAEIYADTPFAVEVIRGGSSGVRKYPEGDWMTSQQWFESVEGAFTSQSMVDIVDPASGEGLLIAHKGNQQWFTRDGALYCVLAAEDPWDGSFFRARHHRYHDDGNRWSAGGEFRLHPHGPIDHAERWKIGREFQQRWLPYGCFEFAFADLEPSGVVVTAFYREAEDFAGKHVENYAGKGMGYPYVLRLVELNGEPAEVELTIVGPVARAYKTNLLGQIESEILPESSPPNRPSQDEPLGAGGFVYDTLRFPMRPHEIATLYLDIVPGRKQTRDLDAKREIWATVHRVD